MVPKLKTILFASDLSENSKYVFDYAVDLAAHYNARILILHVMEEVPTGAETRIAAEIGQQWYTDIKTHKEDSARDILIDKRTQAVSAKDFLSRMSDPETSQTSSYVEDIIIVEGDVAEEVAAISAQKDCDVIVMGGKRSGFLEGAFSGNILRRVLRRSKKPLLVVPLPEPKKS
ncbi:universal stress protein [Desulfosarcina sp. OttesenSCG-928-A07]|nr:universal stress protein [Desulfosarcina sp. OttesenSCG-928-G17]MDL2329255.1 universal stress protein [Desulfosarcina sp. OttesenSCG-928-A07]